MEGGGQKYSCTPEDVFEDFRGRRAGVINALTVEVSKFYQLCDPEKEHLCLYGLPNKTWEVNLPVDEVPPALPEPVLGINFARDVMKEKDWLALVSAHSDAWLLAVAFFFAARFNFDKETRSQLFSMVNNLPTIFEVVTVANKKKSKEKSTKSSSKNKKSKSKMSRLSELHAKSSKPLLKDDEDRREEDNENDDEEHENTLCGACGENYANDEFWICCDVCERWFHGKCVRITPARAEYIKQYKCPSCSNKRARDDTKNRTMLY